MLIEHLIEPSVLVEISKSRRNCRDFEREFSKPSPRVISDYPKLKNFVRKVFDCQPIDASEEEKMRLTAIIEFIKENSRVKRQSPFSGEYSFQDNFKAIEGDDFRGICFLSTSDNRLNLSSEILSVNDFLDGVESLPHQRAMPKIASQMTSVLGELLRLSTRITIVDPYFSTQPGVWNTFISLLQASINNSPTENKLIEVLYDGNKNNARSCSHLASSLQAESLDFLHEFSEIRFVEISENGSEAIHNRYIISELGAVSIPYGLQETNESECDDVTLLSKDLYQLRYEQYVMRSGVNIIESLSV